MKTPITAVLLIAGLFSISVFNNSCAKPDHSADLPKEQQVVGKWSINRIQLKIYSGTVFLTDTIIKQSPRPENFVTFGANGNFEYRFNSTTSDMGTYSFAGIDSVVSVSSPNNYRWKMLTLTKDLFTVVNITTHPSYPGAIVEKYQTFVR